MGSTCAVELPTIHCLKCGIIQFQKPERSKCLRCGANLTIVEEVSAEPQEAETRYGTDEYLKRLEDGVCLALKELRKKAHLQQRVVAERAQFGSRTYVSKVENPQGSNRTIPTLHSLERFARALQVETWRIVAIAEEKAGKPEGSGLDWWKEWVPPLKKVRPRDRDEVLAIARSLSLRNVLPAANKNGKV